MEHPLLTFASPTIIVGDKSGVGTAIHEIAHSWVGNTVTGRNWANFWINEGFCVFLERKILSKIKGIDSVKIDAINGNSSAYTSMLTFGLNNTFSSIHPNTTNRNPDEATSRVPYEKGF
jgi:leukotriene-A4 hydrolase